jgi:hypothetical protein
MDESSKSIVPSVAHERRHPWVPPVLGLRLAELLRESRLLLRELLHKSAHRLDPSHHHVEGHRYQWVGLEPTVRVVLHRLTKPSKRIESVVLLWLLLCHLLPWPQRLDGLANHLAKELVELLKRYGAAHISVNRPEQIVGLFF